MNGKVLLWEKILLDPKDKDDIYLSSETHYQNLDLFKCNLVKYYTYG